MSKQDISVIKVNKKSWEKAQEWERKQWFTTQRQRAKYGKNFIWKLLACLGLKPKYRGDDYNYWWKRHFDDYDFLPPTIGNAIELGCGPYTNMRLIIERCNPEHLFLSDPLIHDYVNFKMTFVSEMYRKRLCILDDHPLEKCPFASDFFDLVIMINVLDHVQDAELCIKNVIRITKVGGILIIGQDLTNKEDMQKMACTKGEIGHPIKLNHQWVENLLIKKFKPIIYKILPREEGRNPECHYGTCISAWKKNEKSGNIKQII